MSKPLPQRFPSDDFEITVGGQVYHPHEGEYVEMFVDQSVDEVLAGGGLALLGVEMEAAKGDSDEIYRVGQLTTEYFERIAGALADRLVDWTWTDRRGNPLPKPDGTRGPVARLTNEEVGYLMQLKESAKESLPNGAGASKRSPITSSATGQPQSPRSNGTVRSRGKR